MSHHGREYEREDYEPAYRACSTKLFGAVKVLQHIADSPAWKGAPAATDSWLAENGYNCPTARRKNVAAERARLDEEIRKLEAQRAKLSTDEAKP